MPEATPTDADSEGQTPADGEGQTPEDGDDASSAQTEPKTYSEAYVRQLRREASGYRSKLADAETRLQAIDDRDKTEQQRLSEKATTLETRASEAELRLLRYEIAAERGLDMAAARFLTGTSREEVEASAAELAKLLEPTPKPTAGFDGGARQTAPESKTPEEAHNELLIRSLRRAN